MTFVMVFVILGRQRVTSSSPRAYSERTFSSVAQERVCVQAAGVSAHAQGLSGPDLCLC